MCGPKRTGRVRKILQESKASYEVIQSREHDLRPTRRPHSECRGVIASFSPL